MTSPFIYILFNSEFGLASQHWLMELLEGVFKINSLFIL